MAIFYIYWFTMFTLPHAAYYASCCFMTLAAVAGVNQGVNQGVNLIKYTNLIYKVTS